MAKPLRTKPEPAAPAASKTASPKPVAKAIRTSKSPDAPAKPARASRKPAMPAKRATTGTATVGASAVPATTSSTASTPSTSSRLSSPAFPPGLLLGAHMSIAGGTPKAIERGASIGCTAIQIFLKNANQWHAKAIGAEEASEFRERMAAGPVHIAFAHDSYLVNLGSPSDPLFEKSVAALTDEVERAALLGVPFVVLHPGAPIDHGEEFGLARISAGLTRVLDATKGAAVRLTLENTAGQGSHLGYRFEQLAAMIEGASDPQRLGVCFDTCHAFAAGYDLRTPETYAETMRAFDAAVGLDRLLAIHLNDTRKDLGSRVDRHEHIGQGMLGLEAFRFIMNDPRLAAVPKVLETPKGEDMKEDVENMAVLIGLLKSEKQTVRRQ